MRENYNQTNKKIGCIIHGWRFSVIGLVYKDMNTKMGVLL